MVLVDGDVIRELFGNDLGFTEKDRQIQIGRMQAIASFLEKQSIIVIVAALYANNELLEKNRQIFNEYYEVYLKADIDLLQTREFKELYKNALAQKVKNVVGVDIPWNEPVDPHLVFEVAKGMTPDTMAELIYNNIYKK